MKNSVFISQKDNYEGNFGKVYRSSAIFYYKQDNNFRTTISLMDYWSAKRNLDVWIIFSLRRMDGDLINRETVTFEKGKVINYDEKVENNFEGSLEVEVFSNKNMVIPYAAIMAVYEDENSVSMVHSYGRIYSPHEIEEKRTITVGEESCFTIRDNEDIQSFCVFHNGHGIQTRQTITMEITNFKNEKLVETFSLEELNPYATVKLIPKQIIGDKLISFLDGSSGNLAISFELNTSFTRMLVGNETLKEFQVTHSNFNYSKHKTDKVEEGIAYMHIPKSNFKDYEVIIYPDCSKGIYTVIKGDNVIANFTSYERTSFKMNDGFISISEKSGVLPSRIVTGLSAVPSTENSILPYECSLGIVHKLRPKKSTFWGLISIDKLLDSRIYIIPLDTVYGKCLDKSLTIKIYTENRHKPFEYTIDEKMLKNSNEGLFVSKMFPKVREGVEGRFAWYYFKSESYGGFMTYSTIESPKGSITLEHSF